eukprot:TRINITY_DN490_c0_g4_i1.p1 TRINITY_DN490_c0_g4~~TRINITY_DN490_c0_g4_i1.p1  ORF type:complete len:390 (-),score=60.73 TRINITY_DN490_c0_g4_i1:40-1209(-)
MSRSVALLGLVLLAALVAAAPVSYDEESYLTPAMTDIPQRFEALTVDSGVLAHRPNSLKGVLFSSVVQSNEASWIRLKFDATTKLGGVLGKDAAYLRIVSLLDGAEQYLNAESLEQWSYSSAYFNGDSVRVELVSYANDDNSRVTVSGLWAGLAANQTISSICNSQDQRTLSYDNRNARYISTGGCSGWLINDAKKCFLTAGHCGTDSNGSGVIQFNVPLSSSTGAIVNPPPQDQFAVDRASVQRVNGGVGNDWQYMGTFPNSNTGRTAYQHVGSIAHRLATAAPSPSGQKLRITGYGVTESDLPKTWNQVQKTHSGAYSSASGTSISHRVDTTGGNSGSAIEDLSTGLAIGIHTHGGCNRSGTGANAGTNMNNSGLQSALRAPKGVCA